MDKLEGQLKRYSTQKLREIITVQSASYSSSYIDYVKDELIRRQEDFVFNTEFEKNLAETKDEDLKKLVEEEYDSFHLEYIEIARREYIKRGFKNERDDDRVINAGDAKKYPALRTIAGFITFVAWALAIITVIISIVEYSNLQGYGKLSSIIPLATLAIGALFFVMALSQAEIIKVFLDIEENTRR